MNNPSWIRDLGVRSQDRLLPPKLETQTDTSQLTETEISLEPGQRQGNLNCK